MERGELAETIFSIQLEAIPFSGNYLIAKNQAQEGIYLI